MQNLITQAVDNKDRCKTQPYTKLKVNNIILLEDKHFNASNFSLARVKKIFINSIEVTDVISIKGKTQEEVKRHASSVIPLLSSIKKSNDLQTTKKFEPETIKERPQRSAAKRSHQHFNFSAERIELPLE